MVRVGPDASEFLRDFEWSLTFRYERVEGHRGEYAVAKGYWRKNLAPSEGEAVVRTVNQATGRLVCFERAENGRLKFRVVQLPLDQTGGRIAMAKEVIKEPPH